MLKDSAPDLVDPATLIRRWILPLLAAAVVGGIVGGVLVGREQSLYETTVVVLVGPVVPDSDLLEGTTDLARTYGEVLESTGVIREAADGSGVSAGRVDVSASAGRDSATLKVRVRTPSRAATEQVAVRLVEILRELVADNRAELSADALGGLFSDGEADQALSDDQTATFPIGSAITVIDDGVDGVSDKSLGPVKGAALGSLVAALIASAIALGAETRRAANPVSRSVVEIFGTDLGRLEQLPAIPNAVLRKRWRRAVPALKSRARKVRYTAEAMPGAQTGPSTVVLLAAPTAHPAYLRAVLRLCSGFAPSPMILDPTEAVRRQFSPAIFDRFSSQRFVVDIDDRMAAELVVPDARHPPTDTASARAELEKLCPGVPVVFVFVSVDDPVSSWLRWASIADRVIALVRPRDLRANDAVPFVSRIELTGVSLDGAITLTRRWLRGRPAFVRVTAVGPIDERSRPQDEPVGQLSGTG